MLKAERFGGEHLRVGEIVSIYLHLLEVNLIVFHLSP